MIEDIAELKAALLSPPDEASPILQRHFSIAKESQEYRDEAVKYGFVNKLVDNFSSDNVTYAALNMRFVQLLLSSQACVEEVYDMREKIFPLIFENIKRSKPSEEKAKSFKALMKAAKETKKKHLFFSSISLLSHLTRSKCFLSLLRESGGMDVFSDVISSKNFEGKSVRDSMKGLHSMLAVPANAEYAVSLRLVKKLTLGIRQTTDPATLTLALSCILLLADHDQHKKEMARESIWKECLNLVKSHEDQRVVMVAVRVLYKFSDDQQVAEFVSLDLKGLDIISSRLGDFDDIFTSYALSVLIHLCFFKKVTQEATKQGVIVRIKPLLDDPECSREVARYALGVLMILVNDLTCLKEMERLGIQSLMLTILVKTLSGSDDASLNIARLAAKISAALVNTHVGAGLGSYVHFSRTQPPPNADRYKLAWKFRKSLLSEKFGSVFVQLLGRFLKLTKSRTLTLAQIPSSEKLRATSYTDDIVACCCVYIILSLVEEGHVLEMLDGKYHVRNSAEGKIEKDVPELQRSKTSMVVKAPKDYSTFQLFSSNWSSYLKKQLSLLVSENPVERYAKCAQLRRLFRLPFILLKKNSGNSESEEKSDSERKRKEEEEEEERKRKEEEEERRKKEEEEEERRKKEEEEERLKKEEEERKRKEEEEERLKKEEEERKRKEEEEARLKKEEEERKRKEEEEKKRKEEEERKRKEAEIKRLADEEERKRKEAMALQERLEEERRIAVAKHRKEEEERRQREEEKKQRELEAIRKRIEAERKRKEEERLKKEEEERQRQEELKKQEEERKRKEEEDRIRREKEEEERKKRLEEERKRKEEERRLQEIADRKRREEEKKREEEQRRKEEEERKKREEELRRQEEERKKQLAIERRRLEEERKKREEEERKQ
ncbi:Cyclin-dependent kinase 5 activator like protein, partial [Aduncisulcus paluster]